MTKFEYKIPKVKFIISAGGELGGQAQYLCFLAKQISAGFYQRQGFCVLPRPAAGSGSVYFPDLEYSSGFWKSIVACPHASLARNFPATAAGEAGRLLAARPETLKPGLIKWRRSQTAELWLKSEKKFWRQVTNLGIFNRQLQKIANLTVLPTPFGTPGSFDYRGAGAGYEIRATLRTDQSAGELAFILFKTLLIMKEPAYKTEKWPEGQAVIRFLLSQADFVKLFSSQSARPLPTAAMMAESRLYLKKLGFPAASPITTLNGRILVGGRFADRYLSGQELKVLELLVKHGGKIVSPDDIAEELWKDLAVDKFSDWAISKLIQRLRNKLRKIGINQRLILSIRGKGYSL